jgi:hypothetical protein
MKILNISSLNRDNTTALVNPDSLFTNKGLGINIYVDTSSGTINNLDTLSKSAVKLTQATTLTGLSSGEDGKFVIIHNANSSNLIVKNLSSSSTLGNRINTGSNSDLTVMPDVSILLQYDGDSTVWRVVGGSGSSDFNITSIKTANYSAFNLDVILCDTSSSSFTVTLPSSPLDNSYVAILDVGGNFSTNNLVISSSDNIENVNETWGIDINYAYVELMYSSSASSWFFKEIPAILNGVSKSIVKTSHNGSFGNSDLTAGLITISHNLNVLYPIVQVYDNTGKQIIPTEVISQTVDTIQLDLSGYGTITGTWRVRVV